VELVTSLPENTQSNPSCPIFPDLLFEAMASEIYYLKNAIKNTTLFTGIVVKISHLFVGNS
jgi:hypothetical protein